MAQRSWRRAGALVLAVMVTTARPARVAGEETAGGRPGDSRAELGESGFEASVSPGDRVRVFAKDVSDEPLIGTVTSRDRDTLVLSSKDQAAVLRFRWSSIQDLDISRGDRQRRTKTGALIGAAIVGVPLGLAGGALGGFCLDAEGPARARCGRFDMALATAWLMGGAAIGGLIGGVLGNTERWDEVPLRKPRVRIGVAPQRGGAAAAVAVTF